MMKYLIWILVYLIPSFLIAKIAPLAVYQEDGRIEVFQTEDEQIFENTKSVAAIIRNQNIQKNNNGQFSIQTQPYGTSQKMCADEKFHNQPTAAICTAFLVKEDVLMTAGHCFKILDCDQFSYVFDFEMSDTPSGAVFSNLFKPDQIYNCHKLIYLGEGKNNDVALIQLDRKVLNRKPLQLDLKNQPQLGDLVYLIGYPSGLPSKVDPESQVIKINLEGGFFTTHLDAFGANSGSPVFSKASHLVNGILVRGEYDFEWDNMNNCRRTKKCNSLNCKGEEALILNSEWFPSNYKTH